MPKRQKPAAAPADAAIDNADTNTGADTALADAEAAGLLPPARIEYVAVTGHDLLAGRLFSSPLNARGDDREAADIDATGLSIVQRGLLQAIGARIPAFPIAPDQRFEVLFGETRFQGMLKALGPGIPDAAGRVWRLSPDYAFYISVRVCDDDTAAIVSGIENTRHAAMPALREAASFGRERARLVGADGPGFAPHKRVEDAIAETFGVGTRTVFRRLALLRLVPEIQAALARKDITNAQAEAFARGSQAEQKRYWKTLEDPRADWRAKPDTVTQAMLREKIPLEHAIFDPALYTGEIVESDDGALYAGDAEEFTRLQTDAIAAELERLRAKWPWAELLRNPSYGDYQDSGIRKTDKEAGAVIAVRGTRVSIHAPALLKATIQQRERQAAADRKKAEGKDGGDAKAGRPPLYEGQVRAVHGAKTRALRRGLVAHETAALAAACLGLLGAHEVRGMQSDNSWQMGAPADRYDSPPALSQAALAILATAAETLPPDQRPPAGAFPEFVRTYVAGQGYTTVADPALWLRALAALPLGELLALLRHLVAERCGSWAGANAQSSSAWLGDSPMAIALADTVGAAALLADEWAPDRDYFNGYARDRISAIARFQLGRADANKLGKKQLVDACVGQPAGFWRPEHFAELRFQDEATAAQAFAGPVPVPPPATTDPSPAERPRGVPVSVIDDARGLIGRFDGAVLTGEEARQAIVAAEFWTLVEQTDAGQLAAALHAKPGAAPLWGQPGAFRLDLVHPAMVVPVEIVTEGLFDDDYFAFEARAIDPALPFLNAAGFERFDFPDSAPVAIDIASWATGELARALLAGPTGETLATPRPLVPLNDAVRARLAAAAPPPDAAAPPIDQAAAEAACLALLDATRARPADALAAQLGLPEREVKDALTRLLLRGAVRNDPDPKYGGWKLPRPAADQAEEAGNG